MPGGGAGDLEALDPDIRVSDDDNDGGFNMSNLEARCVNLLSCFCFDCSTSVSLSLLIQSAEM